MGMSTDVILGHYIELKEVESDYLHNYPELEDEYCVHWKPNNKIITSNSCMYEAVYHWEGCDEDSTHEITIKDISESHFGFVKAMGSVIRVLKTEEIKYEIKFGIISTTN